MNSESTTELMLEFHRQLRSAKKRKETVSISKAWRKAMLNEMNQPTRRHPFYWSGFITIGSDILQSKSFD